MADPPAEDPQQWRQGKMQLLFDTFANLKFTDPDHQADSADMSNTIGGFITKLVEKYEEYFCTNKESSDTRASQVQCLSFTEWVVRFLLNVFSKPPPIEINPQACAAGDKRIWIFHSCSQALIQLLRVVGRNDSESFRVFQSNLQSLAIDLARYRLFGTLSPRMSCAGGLLVLNHLHSFIMAPDSRRGWQAMKLTTGKSSHEVESLLLGVVRALCDSRSISAIGLEMEESELFFRVGHLSPIRVVQSGCVKWFTISANWQLWSQEQVSTFIQKMFGTTIDGNLMAGDCAMNQMEEFDSHISTLYHLLYFTHTSGSWRREILLCFIRMGWDAPDAIRDKTVQYVKTTSVLLGHKRQVDYVFSIDSEFLTNSMMRLLLKRIQDEEITIQQAADMFHSGLKLFGDAYAHSFKFQIFGAAVRGNETEIALVKEISSRSSFKLQQLIQMRFSSICAMLVEKADDFAEDVEPALNQVAQLAGLNTSDLLQQSRSLARDVLFHFAKRKHIVYKVIDRLNRLKGSKLKVTNEKELSDFILKNHCLSRMLDLANVFIRNSGISSNSNKIMSLTEVLEVAGRDAVRPVSSQMITLLSFCVRMVGLTHEEYALIGNLFESFLNNIPFEVLDQNLPLICYDLLTLSENLKAKSISLLEKLICKNLNELKGKVRDICFVVRQDDPAFAKINEAIEMTCARLPEEPPHEYISSRTKEIAKRREFTMKTLLIGEVRNYISRHYETLITSEYIHPCVSELISTLLKDAKQPDADLSLAISRCLGEIGAIDPTRFDSVPASDHHPDNQIMHFDVDSNSFMVNILSKIGQWGVSFSDHNSQWLIMYGLQQLVRSLSVDRREVILKKLDDDVRSDCESVFDSQYTIVHDGVWAEAIGLEPDVTVFNLRDNRPDVALKYEEWLRIWAKRMITKLNKKSTAYTVLSACAPLLTKDYRLTESLLPCIIFNFLRDETIPVGVRRTLVFHEMTQVIRAAIPDSYFGMDSDAPQTFNNSTAAGCSVVVSAPILNELQQLSAQQIFVIYDHLRVWNKEKRVELVEELISEISEHHLAALAYACRSYARSILYLEKSLKKNSSQTFKQLLLELLQKNFIALDEPDGVAGVESKQDETSLMNRIMAHESTCQLRKALSCCAKGARTFPEQIVYRKFMIRCFLALDLIQEAYDYAAGVISSQPEWEADLLPFMIQAAWRLSKWSKLTELLRKIPAEKSDVGMNVHFGRILNRISTQDINSLTEELDQVRISALSPIAAIVSEKGAYERCYHELVKLHIITDIQRAALDLFDMEPEPNTRPQKGIENLSFLWNNRNSALLSSSQGLEPVLSMQRVLLSMHHDEDAVATMLTESWVKSARIARKTGNIAKAETCVLEIESLLEKDVVSSQRQLVSQILVEVAKCHWAAQDVSSKEMAVKYLSRGMKVYFSDFSDLPDPTKSPVKLTQRRTKWMKHFSRVRLLHTKYLEDGQSADEKDLIAGYKQAILANDKWEKPYFRLGRLYDRIASVTQDMEKRVKYMGLACQHYFHSLQRGCKKVYQSLPRLIEIWCEMGSIAKYLKDVKQQQRRERGTEAYSACGEVQNTFKNVTDEIFAMLHKVIQTEFLYTAFSQMMSRVNHPNPVIGTHLVTILTNVSKMHPHQCFWPLLSALMSSETQAAARKTITEMVSQSSSKKLYEKISQVGNALQKLAEEDFKIAGRNIPYFKTHKNGPKVAALLKGCPIPYRKFLTVTMPQNGVYDRNHKFFADEVFITDVSDSILMFSSVAKPKKIVLIGNDKKEYPLLVKPKDDMRMDSRAMELMEMVNRLLMKSPESRKRQLNIRCFQVVPFGEEGGVCEFVDGVKPIRDILLSEYSRVEKYDAKVVLNGVRNKYPDLKVTASTARSKFLKDIMPHFQKPVLGNWFLENFSDASNWYTARNEFTRSLAVMSIVGYIIGLGDRHLENILLDKKTGQIVHVDFNMLFNRGLDLQVPEVVPFRLTHNLVDVMGATGYEGIFRRTCEITLQVMRDNREELLSVLKPFVFDPFAGHEKSDKKTKQKADTSFIVREGLLVDEIRKIEIRDENAAVDLQRIEDRLQGRLRHKIEVNPLTFSVAGQVNALIQEATDINNLCRMYCGWASFL